SAPAAAARDSADSICSSLGLAGSGGRAKAGAAAESVMMPASRKATGPPVARRRPMVDTASPPPAGHRGRVTSFGRSPPRGDRMDLGSQLSQESQRDTLG